MKNTQSNVLIHVNCIETLNLPREIMKHTQSNVLIYDDISKKADLQALIDSLSQKFRRILDYMLIHSIKNINNFVCQNTISKQTGISLSTIKRAIKYFYSVNIITYKKQRGFNKSNLYKFNELLFAFKDSFSVILPCLKWCKKQLHKPVMYINELLCFKGRRVIYNSISKTMVVREFKVQFTQSQPLRGGSVTIQKQKRNSNGVRIMESLPKITNQAIEKAHEKFNLTDLGRAKLMVFTENALSLCISKSGSFDELIQNCVSYSDTHQIKVDWAFYFMIKKRYSLVDDKKYCIPLAKSKTKNASYTKFVVAQEIELTQEQKDDSKKLLLNAAEQDSIANKLSWMAECTRNFAMNQFS